MAWTAPRTWVTGEIVTAAQLNEQIRDNMNMLIQKDGSVAFAADQPMGGFSLTGLAAGAATGESARYDELHAVSQDIVTGSRALATNYQNTSGKTRIVAVGAYAVSSGAGAYLRLIAKSENATPPTTNVADVSEYYDAANGTLLVMVYFVVPDDYYYQVAEAHANTAAVVLNLWTEWDLH